MVHGVEDFSASSTTYGNFIVCISKKNNKSLQLPIALYYLPIVLRIKTKHNFIPFYLWSPD